MKVEYDQWGYQIHSEMNYESPQGDFETRVALVIAFSVIISMIVFKEELVWLMLG